MVTASVTGQFSLSRSALPLLGVQPSFIRRVTFIRRMKSTERSTFVHSVLCETVRFASVAVFTRPLNDRRDRNLQTFSTITVDDCEFAICHGFFKTGHVLAPDHARLPAIFLHTPEPYLPLQLGTFEINWLTGKRWKLFHLAF